MSSSNKVSFMLMDSTIHLSLDGRHVTLTTQSKNFGPIRQLIKENDPDLADKIRELLTEPSVKIVEEFIVGSGFTVVNGRVQDKGGNTLPEVLENRIRSLRAEGQTLQVDHLVLFWENLNQNPSLRSREQLYKFLEQNGHPITDDGMFIAYRGVRADFKDVHTGTFDNTPGRVISMPRRDVDDDPTRTCSKGFHVAAWEYAKSFGAVTLEVKVNPRDVVAVPVDYNGQKMRVCQFEVIRQCESMNTSQVYDSTYVEPDYDWDDDEEDEEAGLADDDVDQILELADEYGDRYKDRTVLASRIEEDMHWLTTAEILEVLNNSL